jgi:hypothetical protein
VLVRIRPSVGQVDFASLGANIGKGVKYMSELVAGKVLRVEVATINSLWPVSMLLWGR